MSDWIVYFIVFPAILFQASRLAHNTSPAHVYCDNQVGVTRAGSIVGFLSEFSLSSLSDVSVMAQAVLTTVQGKTTLSLLIPLS